MGNMSKIGKYIINHIDVNFVIKCVVFGLLFLAYYCIGRKHQ